MISRSKNDTTTDLIPLCVDLDGTLVKSDTLWEALFVMIRRRPLDALLLPFWVFGGKAQFKQRIADRVELDPASLPYNERFLAYLREQAALGRPIVLATAANQAFANKIADHLGLFTDVIASDAAHNVVGDRKLEMLEQRCGAQQFDYAANAKADLHIWRRARQAILVNPDKGIEKRVREATTIAEVFETRGPILATYLRAIRVHQWLKNLLVFLPLLASHQWELALLMQAGVAFLAFSLCASSAYLINDLLDLPADRNHSKKRNRPLAQGDMAIPSAVMLASGLLVIGVGISLTLPATFLALLASYYMATLLYSIFLKRIALVDVLTLAGLYTLRVLAGGAAVMIMPSFWLLALSMFLFLSLALVKRGAELQDLDGAGIAPIGRSYGHSDLELLKTMGVASGYMAVLVVALYINSEEVLQNYSRPQMLWLVCPLLLYWVSRLWLKTGRSQMHHDPLVFAIKDPISQILGVLILASVLLAV